MPEGRSPGLQAGESLHFSLDDSSVWNADHWYVKDISNPQLTYFFYKPEPNGAYFISIMNQWASNIAREKFTEDPTLFSNFIIQAARGTALCEPITMTKDLLLIRFFSKDRIVYKITIKSKQGNPPELLSIQDISDIQTVSTHVNSRIYINKIKWHSPPSNLHKTYKEGDCELIIIIRNGDLAVISATIFRDTSTNRMSIREGCGFSARKGTWYQNGADRLYEISFWTHRDFIPVLDGKLSKTYSFHRWFIIKGFFEDGFPKMIIADSSKYVPLKSLVNQEILDVFMRDNQLLP